MTAVMDFSFSVPKGPADEAMLLTTTCPNCNSNLLCGQGPEVAPRFTLTLTTTAPQQVCLQVDPVLLRRGLTLTCSSPSPEPSPSDPVSFLIPSPQPQPCAKPEPPPDKSDGYLELASLAATVQALKTSGWFYEGLSWQESATLLVPTSPGTFLVRESSDPRFLFSLSVQTERGPTSVRLHYRDGLFRLDAAPKLAPAMPQFTSVLNLVEHYVTATTRKVRGPTGKEQVWVDCNGRTYSSILLCRPLFRKDRFPSLKHLARLSLQRHRVEAPTDLPTSLYAYLADYPYSL